MNSTVINIRPESAAPAVAIATRDTGRIAALDGLRGIAALLILFGHWIGLGVPAERGSLLYVLKRALWLNASGVDLFFVLSGFLISGILIDERTSPNLLRVFWRRRVARIVPLFVLFLAAFAALAHFPQPPLLEVNSQPLWAHGLFLSNLWTAWSGQWEASYLAITWSLAIEEQFYLVLPFIVLFAAPWQLPRIALLTIAFAPLLRCLVWWLSPGDLSLAAHMLMPCRADAFAVGLLLAWEVRQPLPFWKRVPVSRLFLSGAIVALLLAWLTRRNEWMGSLLYCAVGYSGCALFYGWCVMMALHLRGMATLFAWSPLAWVGRHSYFIYLFHGMIGAAIQRAAPAFIKPEAISPWWTLPLSAVVLGVAASLSMRWFEAPIMRWGRRRIYAAPACSQPA